MLSLCYYSCPSYACCVCCADLFGACARGLAGLLKDLLLIDRGSKFRYIESIILLLHFAPVVNRIPTPLISAIHSDPVHRQLSAK